MKPGSYVSLLYRPDTARELAAGQPVLSAVVINAMYGILVLAAISLQLLQMFTPSLVMIAVILFGPLAGFIVSSLYTRVEMSVGRRLGGGSSLGELYGLFAWSFIPAGLAMLLYTLLVSILDTTSTAVDLIISLPVCALLVCGIRNYTTNIISIQRFRLVRGVVNIILSFILFLVLIAGCLGFLSFLFSYEMGDCVKSMVTQR
jgi:hypothetical protein